MVRVRIRPTIIGMVSRPDTEAEVPDAICRKVGMKASAENMPRPTTRPMALEMTNTRLRNRNIGMMGCSARSSTTTNRATATTKAAIRPRMTGEVQSYCLPPQSVNRIRQVVAVESSTTPR
jgi:hypothetical protein